MDEGRFLDTSRQQHFRVPLLARIQSTQPSELHDFKPNALHAMATKAFGAQSLTVGIESRGADVKNPLRRPQ
jgi:hypothetical protein